MRQNDHSSGDSHAMDLDESENEGEQEAVALGVKISLTPEKIRIRWLKGSDYILFESFYGMLKRNLANST